MNEGNVWPVGQEPNMNCEIQLKPKLNLRYRLLWLVLWPVYIFEWLAGVGDREELQTKLWDSNLWYYKIMMWHERFHDWGEIK